MFFVLTLLGHFNINFYIFPQNSFILLDLLPSTSHFLTTLKCIILPTVTFIYISVQFSSVTQSCLTHCDPMNHSTPGLPFHYQLPEFTQTHVHRVGDAIQPSYPPSSPSPPALNLSQNQGLFQ